ncbi:oligopeptide/dipeptide ABC transporter ATP-binding protein [Pullulanibacillus pueri]|uniref:Peptide ABC transporter ATP-binding protein n=1 Tax=Pullulanibacillus pueri TaxID=1437324 RepID=A0A8J2ZWD8_9BACL|nr:ABC transporter ATP-binding protein [Pullulanibacillus pueri]MBM7682617.1 oligopeptide/dipeptide ABC transporter ATP-binding protein [Pullulanibacillus pueri]GGH82525.1 peptide ABC transporter ATP-binding protein [Pullulanibacillus pueri]
MSEVLQIKDLVTKFSTKKGMVPAVRGVNLSVERGKTLVIIGESGSGKSVTLRSILGLSPQGTEITGSIKFQGDELLVKNEKQIQKIRGNKIAMVFQNSLSAFDPLYRVGKQVEETIKAHRKISRKEAKSIVIDLFREVGIPSPEERRRVYPHEMSGGMRQRAVIAMALACNPDILLADEPTTALDVTIQAQILNLFKKIQKEHGMSIILVTHDIGVAIEMADQIAVMYAGKIVEYGEARQVLSEPSHPYTQALMASTPQKEMSGKIVTIPGQPPLITNMPEGCAFSDRCPYAESACTKASPELDLLTEQHRVACFMQDKMSKEA